MTYTNSNTNSILRSYFLVLYEFLLHMLFPMDVVASQCILTSIKPHNTPYRDAIPYPRIHPA